MHKNYRRLLVICLVLVGCLFHFKESVGPYAAGQTTQTLESQLKELKRLHDQGLIPTDIYKSRVDSLLGNPTSPSTSPAPSPSSAPSPSMGSDLRMLNGLWNLRVESLPALSPNSTLKKRIGLVYWKLSYAAGRLYVKEYTPGNNDPVLAPGSGIGAMPFHDVETADQVFKQNSVSFKVPGSWESYDYYKLDQISERRITGRYRTHQPWGGLPGYGPDYEGRLILERVKE